MQDSRQPCLLSVLLLAMEGGSLWTEEEESTRVCGRKRQEGEPNAMLNSVSLGQAAGCISRVPQVLPSLCDLPLLPVRHSPEVAFTASQGTPKGGTGSVLGSVSTGWWFSAGSVLQLPQSFPLDPRLCK